MSHTCLQGLGCLRAGGRMAASSPQGKEGISAWGCGASNTERTPDQPDHESLNNALGPGRVGTTWADLGLMSTWTRIFPEERRWDAGQISTWEVNLFYKYKSLKASSGLMTSEWRYVTVSSRDAFYFKGLKTSIVILICFCFVCFWFVC